MKLIAESKGLERLAEIRSRFTEAIRDGYEHCAKPCSSCKTPGICCQDEHFVNVRITRLEAAAIACTLAELGADKRDEVVERAYLAIEKYGLSGSADADLQTFACPLYESGTGCLVHDSAKPLPCVAHACYERKEDLPPEEMLAESEFLIAQLSRRVYGSVAVPAPLPVAMSRQMRRASDDVG